MVADGGGGRDRLAEHALGLVELPEVNRRLAQIREQTEPVGIELRHQVDRPAQEAGGGVHFATRERPLAGTGQPLRRHGGGIRGRGIVERTGFRQVPVRLLEVVRR